MGFFSAKRDVTAAYFPALSLVRGEFVRGIHSGLPALGNSDGGFTQTCLKSQCLPASNGVYFCQLPDRALLNK